MRDPDLVVRAQRAATALENAWCHWRDVHGLTADSRPPVSSYVGYSLDAPWGEARIVFGVSAEDAEQLAALLEGHDCVGPVHASVTARPVGPLGPLGLIGPVAPPGRSPDPADPVLAGTIPAGPGSASVAPADTATDAGLPLTAAGGARPCLVHVPAPAPVSAGQHPLPPGAVLSRPSAPAGRPGPRYRDQPDATPLTAAAPPAAADVATPIALAASRAVAASLAAQRAPATGTSSANASREAGRPASAADRSGGDDRPSPAAPDTAPREATTLPEPHAPEPYVPEPYVPEWWAPGPSPAESHAAEPPIPKMLVVPEVVAFRPKRTGQASHTPATTHEMAVPGPAPALGPPPGALDHLAASGTNPAPWTVGDVPGQPTVTDTAV